MQSKLFFLTFDSRTANSICNIIHVILMAWWVNLPCCRSRQCDVYHRAAVFECTLYLITSQLNSSSFCKHYIVLPTVEKAMLEISRRLTEQQQHHFSLFCPKYIFIYCVSQLKVPCVWSAINQKLSVLSEKLSVLSVKNCQTIPKNWKLFIQLAITVRECWYLALLKKISSKLLRL